MKKFSTKKFYKRQYITLEALLNRFAMSLPLKHYRGKKSKNKNNNNISSLADISDMQTVINRDAHFLLKIVLILLFTRLPPLRFFHVISSRIIYLN